VGGWEKARPPQRLKEKEENRGTARPAPLVLRAFLNSACRTAQAK